MATGASSTKCPSGVNYQVRAAIEICREWREQKKGGAGRPAAGLRCPLPTHTLACRFKGKGPMVGKKFKAHKTDPKAGERDVLELGDNR